LAAFTNVSGVQVGREAASETTFDSTLISDTSFETLAIEYLSAARITAMGAVKPTADGLRKLAQLFEVPIER
jgi:hypothetical protein